MPHIIIEYAQDACPEQQLPALLQALHQDVINSGLFERDNIKTRLIPVQHYQLSDACQAYVAIQCRIHGGRSVEQKQQLSQSLAQTALQFVPRNTVITAEVVEMDRNSYTKCISD